MKHFFGLALVFFMTINLYSKKINPAYIASSIPDSLKKEASAVIINDDKTVEIISLSKVVITVHKAITVLKESGERKAWEAVHYNKNTNILNLNAKMYNATGIEINNWKKNDWNDEGYDSYGTAYSDLRRKSCFPANNTYPYTIEYDYSYEENNTYGIEGWYPIWEDNLSVLNSTYELICNPSVKIKYKEYNFSDGINKTSHDNITKWEIRNISANHKEPYRPSRYEYEPYLRVGLEHFKYNNYEGSTDSWKEYGEFFSTLNEGRDNLPEDRIAEVDAILDTCEDDFSKVKALYKYMQSHTRYVNISIGIGGIQTFPAAVVSENGYGDCKALSNYMTALLKHAGIKSYFTLVKAGAYNYSFDPNFITHQANHAIVCVPLANDTIWLECTSQTMPCGFLGDFTDNRPVLLITENGGVLTKTPRYNKNTNKIVRNTSVTINASGDCKADINSKYTGLEYDEKHRLTTQDKETQLKMLYNDFKIPNFKISSFDLNPIYNRNPILNEKINMELTKYASRSGSRLFVPLNMASRWNHVPQKTDHRKYKIYKNAEFINIDTAQYSLPEGYQIEVLPQKKEINTKYGKYSINCYSKNNIIYYTRRLEVNSGVYPAQEYNDFVAFFSEINKNDNAMAILKQNE